MAALLPTVFRKSGEATINFDYTDFSTGLGYEIFYGAKTASGAYLLTDNVIYSDIAGEDDVVGGASYAQEISVDFDSSAFNLPRTMKGTAILQIPVGVYNDNGATTAYASGALIHYDGTTEIVLGNADGILTPLREAGATTNKEKVYCLSITLANKQLFKVGDIIRFRCQVYARRTAAGSCMLGYDPKDRTFTSGALSMTVTPLQVHVPFVIDI